MINILKEINDEILDNVNERFKSINLELSSIDAENKVTNIIPESINAKLNIRFNDI